MVRKETLAVAIRSHKLFSAGNVERFIEEFIGTIVKRNLLFRDASIDWRTYDFLEVLSNNIETVINEHDTSTVDEIEKNLEELQK